MSNWSKNIINTGNRSPSARRRAALKLFSVGLLVPLTACGQGKRKVSKGIMLSVELISYMDTGAYAIEFNNTDLGVMAPYGGTGVITGVRVPYGVQSLSWKIAGPEGTPGNGETRAIKNQLIVAREQIPPGTRYLGLHLYPDHTAEITFSEGVPEITVRGRKVLERKK